IGGRGGSCGGSGEASGVAPLFEPGREPALEGLLDLSLPAATIIAPTEGVEAGPARTEPRSEAAPSATAAVVVTAPPDRRPAGRHDRTGRADPHHAGPGREVPGGRAGPRDRAHPTRLRTGPGRRHRRSSTARP